jgi:hypothetical protein
MVDFLCVSSFIEIANIKFNDDIFKEEIWNHKKRFFSIVIFL